MILPLRRSLLVRHYITLLHLNASKTMFSTLTGGLSIWEKPEQKAFQYAPIRQSATLGVAPEKSTIAKKAGVSNWMSRFPAPKPSVLSLEDRVQSCLSICQECVNPEELAALLSKKACPIAYDGFEPSGRMHIAQGLLKARIVNKLTSAGCVFVFWVADWFAMLNGKMGGDLKKIRKVGEYFIEVWKSAGMDMENVRFLWASDEINDDANDYWVLVMNIARSFNISRIKRCSQIMGRSEGDDQQSAQILYPCMQCADIFYLSADICQLGMDQRKVNMLAREYCEVIKRKNKPIVLSHTMLPGLLEGQEKMSKSNPDSALFMDDNEAEIKRKLKKAYCPPGVLEGNPCIAYMEHIVFPLFSKVEVCRTEANGGNITFNSFEEMKESYLSGALHPGDLKDALTKAINRALEPIRNHFDTNKEAKQLLEQVKSYKTTR